MGKLLPIAVFWGCIGGVFTFLRGNLAISSTLLRILPTVMTYPIFSLHVPSWASIPSAIHPNTFQNMFFGISALKIGGTVLTCLPKPKGEGGR